MSEMFKWWTACSVALLLAAPLAAEQQGVVYTNVVDGKRVDGIVQVVRNIRPAVPVPASIVSTPVLPRNYYPPTGPTSYVPPPRVAHSAPPPTPPSPPWYVNGIYMGPSPNGHWMSTTVGRPIVDVNIIGVPTRPEVTPPTAAARRVQ